MSEIIYSKERIEKYFKKNYPINWYTWLNRVFDSLESEYLENIHDDYQEI